VADRENSRIQIFDSEGQFITQWTDVTRPNGLAVDADDAIYVFEVGYRYGPYPFM